MVHPVHGPIETLVHRLVEISIEHNLKLAEKALDIGADAILSGDDYGTGRGAYMLKHCCGNINPLLDDLVGYGIRMLHPLDENSGIDQIEVKKKYPSLTVVGAIDCDKPLTDYTPEQMEEYVKSVLATHAPGGRYICASSNSVHSSAKPENFVAMQKAVHKYGKYRPDGSLDWM